MIFIRKSDVFQTELGWIRSAEIREFATKCVERLPDYFFHVAASSTGKYHPQYALGEGGLVRHTKAAAFIAHDLLGLEMYGKYSDTEKDIIIAAILLHDGYKHSLSDSAGSYTVAEHPMVASKQVLDLWEQDKSIPESYVSTLCNAIESHMGQWNTAYRSNKEIMPKPTTAIQKFVHQADYLASRKYLQFDFGEDYYNPSKYEDVQTSNCDELKSLIDDIVSLCKQLINNGIDNKTIYKVIADINNGNRNPNSITDYAVANHVMEELKHLSVKENT